VDITTIAPNTMTTAEEWVINADHDDAGMRIHLMNVTTRTTTTTGATGLHACCLRLVPPLAGVRQSARCVKSMWRSAATAGQPLPLVFEVAATPRARNITAGTEYHPHHKSSPMLAVMLCGGAIKKVAETAALSSCHESPVHRVNRTTRALPCLP
jgi:hypothetical protein